MRFRTLSKAMAKSGRVSCECTVVTPSGMILWRCGRVASSVAIPQRHDANIDEEKWNDDEIAICANCRQAFELKASVQS